MPPPRARGVSWVGLRPWFQIYSLVWSGNRTRDTRFMRPMLYPTELSSGGRTGFEPVANGMRRCSASELPSARGTPSPDPRHTPRQRRAHRMGRANPCRSEPFERCSALAPPTCIESANPCAIASACRPCRSIQARRILAPSRCFPASGQQCPDASGARCNRVVIVWWIPLRTPETKRPRVPDPRAFAWPREIGVTDLRDGERSVDGGGAEGIPLAAHRGQCDARHFNEHAARTQSRIALGRCRIGVDVEGVGHGIHGWKNRRLAKVAHLTRMFFVWQRNFYIADERRASRVRRLRAGDAFRAPRTIHGQGGCDATSALHVQEETRVVAGVPFGRWIRRSSSAKRCAVSRG